MRDSLPPHIRPDGSFCACDICIGAAPPDRTTWPTEEEIRHALATNHEWIENQVSAILALFPAPERPEVLAERIVAEIRRHDWWWWGLETIEANVRTSILRALRGEGPA